MWVQVQKGSSYRCLKPAICYSKRFRHGRLHFPSPAPDRMGCLFRLFTSFSFPGHGERRLLSYIASSSLLAMARRALAYIAAFRFLTAAMRPARAALILAFIPLQTSVLSEKQVHPCAIQRDERKEYRSLDRTTISLAEMEKWVLLG